MVKSAIPSRDELVIKPYLKENRTKQAYIEHLKSIMNKLKITEMYDCYIIVYNFFKYSWNGNWKYARQTPCFNKFPSSDTTENICFIQRKYVTVS